MKRKYPDVRWYDYLWFLIPVAGIVGHILAIEQRPCKRSCKDPDFGYYCCDMCEKHYSTTKDQ